MHDIQYNWYPLAICPPSSPLLSSPFLQLPNWLRYSKVWCKINHAFIDPLHSHYSRTAIATVIHSTSVIFHEIFVCIKRTTSQTVQSNCPNGIYSFRSKVMKGDPMLWTSCQRTFHIFCYQKDHCIALQQPAQISVNDQIFHLLVPQSFSHHKQKSHT